MTPWTEARQASLSITNSQSLLKLMSIEWVMPSNHLILCRPLLPLPSIFPSIRVFSNESPLHSRWPKYQSFSFSISPSSEHPGLISFRMDWLDLLAVQGTLKSLLQHHSSLVDSILKINIAISLAYRYKWEWTQGSGIIWHNRLLTPWRQPWPKVKQASQQNKGRNSGMVLFTYTHVSYIDFQTFCLLTCWWAY